MSVKTESTLKKISELKVGEKFQTSLTKRDGVVLMSLGDSVLVKFLPLSYKKLHNDVLVAPSEGS